MLKRMLKKVVHSVFGSKRHYHRYSSSDHHKHYGHQPHNHSQNHNHYGHTHYKHKHHSSS